MSARTESLKKSKIVAKERLIPKGMTAELAKKKMSVRAKAGRSLSAVPQGSWEFIGNATFLFEPNPQSIIGAGAPQLMTDGTILLFELNFPRTGNVWKLTPDIFGNYANGTWSQLASLPTIGSRQYTPLYFPSAVLADGRLIIGGGEYQGPRQQFIFTPEGSEGANYVAIYNPVTNKWAAVPPPAFFGNNYPPRAEITPSVIGDAASVVLEDGTWMVQDKMTAQAALLNLATMTWTETGTPTKEPYWNDEENLTLLPNGKVLTVNCYTEAFFCPCPNTVCTGCYPYPADPTHSQIYNPKTGTWASAGSTIKTLTDPIHSEIGIAVLRPDGTVFCTGVDADNVSIYDSKTATWSSAPPLPLFPILTGFLNITAPAPVVGSYSAPELILPPGGQSTLPLPINLTGNIVQTNPPDAIPGPYAPLPPNSIALIIISAQSVNDYGFFIDLDSVAAAKAAGAIGVVFVDQDVELAGFIFGGDYVIPTLVADKTLGKSLLDNTAGLAGTMSIRFVDSKLGNGDSNGILLPNSNVLFTATSSVDAAGGPPLTFLKFDGVGYSLEPLPFALFGSQWFQNLVGLPTGQILAADSAYGDINIYTPADQTYDPAWAPRVCRYPDSVNPGKTYRIDGYLFNGMSQTADGSDDGQSPTNYPLVRITNKITGHVFYCRTHNHSYMGVAATDKLVHTYFDVPTRWAGYDMELGNSIIEVVANGIPSAPIDIIVARPAPIIICSPDEVHACKTYKIKYEYVPEAGVYFHAVVRITNDKTGNYVNMPIQESGDCKRTCNTFYVPKGIECGKSQLTIIVVGSSSEPKPVYVKKHHK